MARDTSKPASNKMKTMGENKLLLDISLPMMISMIVLALYNIVDSIFVSNISEDALTAVSLNFPVQMLIVAVSVGTGVGINALMSRLLGQGMADKASKAANVGIFLSIISSLVFMVLGFFAFPFFSAQTEILGIVEDASDYMFYICVFSYGSFGQIVFSRFLQSTGRTFDSMIIQLVGAILNIILDPILIFGLLGAPAMGVKGAAVATVIGQWVGFVLAIYLNHRNNHEIKISIKEIRFDPTMARNIYQVGAPAILMQSIGSIMSFSFNLILLSFTETAVAVFGAYFKIQGFFFMPVFGLNNGVVSIVAYNYGAREPKRILKTVKLAMMYATGVMILGVLVFQFMAPQLLGLFKASEDMLAIGTMAFRIISPSFLLAGVAIVASAVFQATGHGFQSMIVAIVRQLVVLVPVGYLFSLTGNIDLVWTAFPISETVSFLFSLYFIRRVYKKEIKPMLLELEEKEKLAAENKNL